MGRALRSLDARPRMAAAAVRCSWLTQNGSTVVAGTQKLRGAHNTHRVPPAARHRRIRHAVKHEQRVLTTRAASGDGPPRHAEAVYAGVKQM